MSFPLVPSPTEQEIQVLITLMAQLRICNYVTGERCRPGGEGIRYLQTLLVSALVFMLYDIIINLEKEVGLFLLLWKEGIDIGILQIPLVWRYRQNDHASSLHDFRRLRQVLVHFVFIFSRYYGLVFLSCVHCDYLRSTSS